LVSSQRLWVKQTSWIYRLEATASCYILCNGVVENKVTLGSDLSRTTAAYTIWAVTSLLPFIYDYAGAHNAVNPPLYNRAWPTNLFLYKENPLFNNLESLQEVSMRKLSTGSGTILFSHRSRRALRLMRNAGHSSGPRLEGPRVAGRSVPPQSRNGCFGSL
jgi:hypothetical protein